MVILTDFFDKNSENRISTTFFRYLCNGNSDIFMIRKTIYCMILFLFALSLSAQKVETSDSVQATRLTAPGEKPFTIEHEVQLGFGDILMTNALYRNGGVWASDAVYHPTDLFAQDVYHGAEMSSGAISVSYTCRTKKWLWFGASLTYSGFYKPAYDRVTNEPAHTLREHFVSIMPTVRFSYINRKYLTLYSGLAIGGAVVSNEMISYNLGSRQVDYNFNGKFVFQATAIGISAGYKVYAFAELGAGVRGYFYGGIGYRFNTVERKK